MRAALADGPPVRAALAVLLVASLAAGSAAAAVAPPLTVTTSVSPRPAFFGDAVTAEVRVIGRGAESVRVEPDFGPLRQLSPVRRTSERGAGGLSVLRFRFTLACTSEACLPSAGRRLVALPLFAVRGVRVRWPAVEVAPRLGPGELSPPAFRTQLEPPPVSYRIDPGMLSAGLLAAAALLVLVAAGLVARVLLARRRLRAQQLSPLEQALAALRAATGAEERRRGLGTLARALAPSDRELAGRAEGLAWSHERPSSECVDALALAVERGAQRT